jgi:hypothetical protein
VRTKIKLVRWDRPSEPTDRNCPVLQCIVGNILKVLQSGGQKPTRLPLKIAKRTDSTVGEA